MACDDAVTRLVISFLSSTRVGGFEVLAGFMLVYAPDNQRKESGSMTQLSIRVVESIVNFPGVHAYLCTSTLDKQYKES